MQASVTSNGNARRCPQCGVFNTPGRKTCEDCGSDLEPAQKRGVRSTDRRPRYYVLLTVVCLAVQLGLYRSCAASVAPLQAEIQSLEAQQKSIFDRPGSVPNIGLLGEARRLHVEQVRQSYVVVSLVSQGALVFVGIGVVEFLVRRRERRESRERA
jgi:hypothetical protein